MVKYLKNGDVIVLHNNGNVAENRQDGLWRSTNNKGKRSAKRISDNATFEMGTIPSAYKEDESDGSKILKREDNVVVVTFKDGAMYTQHSDGTRIFTSPDKTEITIEHDGKPRPSFLPHLDYATMKVRYDPSKSSDSDAQAGEQGQQDAGKVFTASGEDACAGQTNLMERSSDGRVVETYLHDGTKVCGFRENVELTTFGPENEDGEREASTEEKALYTHLVYGYDASVLKIREDGEVVVISEADRHALAQPAGEDEGENFEGREWLKPNENSFHS